MKLNYITILNINLSEYANKQVILVYTYSFSIYEREPIPLYFEILSKVHIFILEIKLKIRFVNRFYIPIYSIVTLFFGAFKFLT